MLARLVVPQYLRLVFVHNLNVTAAYDWTTPGDRVIVSVEIETHQYLLSYRTGVFGCQRTHTLFRPFQGTVGTGTREIKQQRIS